MLSILITLIGNTIAGNSASHGGGGLHVWLGGQPSIVTANTIISNTSGNQGGGLWLMYSNTVMEQNVINGNVAGWRGGGVFSRGEMSGEMFVNNVIADNQVVNSGGNGSGLYVYGAHPRLVHTTIARNSGGGSGIYLEPGEGGIAANLFLTNTVLVSHSVGISVTANCTLTAHSILWHNTPITIAQSITATVEVQNQYTGDPAFAADGYHLTAGSAAINRGIDAGVTVDIDGEPRPAGTGYDLGADEFWWRYIYLPLVLRH